MHRKYKRTLKEKTMSLCKPRISSSRCAAMTENAPSPVAVMMFFFLVGGAVADFPCKPEQVHWNATTGRRYKCLECPDCPAGSQPSVPCGTSVAYGTPVHCISCQLGRTYSNNYGKARCEACTVCSEGKAIKRNCTLLSNTKCDDKCAEGYYLVPFVFSCFRCEKCCGDAKDEMEQECAHYQNKCKARSVPCLSMPTKASETSTHGTLSTRQSQKISMTLQTTQQDRQSRVSQIPTSTWSGNSDYAGGGMMWSESREGSTQNKTLWPTVALVFAVLAILILLVVFFMWGSRQPGFACHCYSTNVPSAVLFNRQQPASTSQERLDLVGDITLAELESRRLDVFDEICLKIDNGRLWFRRDYERLASKFQRIPLEVRNSFRDHHGVEGESPSKMLMTHLQTKYPELTLRQFAEKLKEIGRNDIEQLLVTRLAQDLSPTQ